MNENDWKCRTELLLGATNINRLLNAHVCIAGLGGVGGYAAEQLCRAGVGHLTLIDCDSVQLSNLNRQIIASQTTLGKLKTSLFNERLKDINPNVKIEILNVFLGDKNISSILSGPFKYMLDAIDTLTPKVALLAEGVKQGKFIVSSMGSGGKTDPSKIKVTDIAESNHCKFAYIVRKYLHRQGIREGIRVVYSPEPVKKDAIIETDGSGYKRSIVGTISYMPALFGCFCAAEIIRAIIRN